MRQGGDPQLSIVVPAYNEARRLPPSLATLLAFSATLPYGAEVIIADDGSTDATAALVEALVPSQAQLRLVRLAHRGKGFAVRAGVLAARGDYVLVCDVDLAVPLDEWSRLREALEAGYDVAIGSREGAGARRVGEPWHRHAMGRVFNAIVRALVVGQFQDTQCGFKAFRGAVARDLFERVQIYGEHAPLVRGAAVTAYDVEVLYLAVTRGYRVAEVPVPWFYGEETKVSALRDAWRNLRDVLRVRWLALRGVYGRGR
jgi:glycosyltransferase involved in cell wall biosynthesis